MTEEFPGNQGSKEGEQIKSETLVGLKECVDQTFVSEKIHIFEDQVRKFVEAVGDIHPIHYNAERSDESAIANSAEGSIIVPGFLTVSLLTNAETLYKAITIDEPHELINIGFKSLSLTEPVYVGQDIIYEFRIKKVLDTPINERPAMVVEWDVSAYKLVGEEKVECLRAFWKVGYVSLPKNSTQSAL